MAATLSTIATVSGVSSVFVAAAGQAYAGLVNDEGAVWGVGDDIAVDAFTRGKSFWATLNESQFHSECIGNSKVPTSKSLIPLSEVVRRQPAFAVFHAGC